MSTMFVLWVAIGVAVGVSHARALWRSAHRTHDVGWWGVAWRLPLVGITLVIAAFAGRLIPAVVGWAGGLAITSAVLLLGQRRWM